MNFKNRYMDGVEDLKIKVLNTLNILSGQNITETKLYKTILTADDDCKRDLIELSFGFAGTFYNFGKLLETTEIYKWLSILIDRFYEEEEINLLELMVSYKLESIISNHFKGPVKKNLIKIGEISENGGIVLTAYDHLRVWCLYFVNRKSNIEKIAKIIQPLELFILTAITVMPVACHIDQKPFEYYANMDLKRVLSILKDEYYEIHQAEFNAGTKFDKNLYDTRINMDYFSLEMLVNGKNYDSMDEAKSDQAALNGKMMDKAFAKIINVSEKSEYEKLKTLYKK